VTREAGPSATASLLVYVLLASGVEQKKQSQRHGESLVGREGSMRFEAPLPVTPRASSAAREFLDGWLSASVGGETADVARIAASELVTNAVRHADLPSDGSLRLLADVDDVTLHVRVEQATSAARARVVTAESRTVGGFGLAIVESLTDAWGSDPGPPGSVWFELDRGGPADASAS
jgi:anti-sigma regulatory factor (Ser/Thr protein kinase)